VSDQPNNIGDNTNEVAGDAYGDLLDHEYDGIHEYDNPTPGWWNLIFIGAVLFAIPYAFFFHWSPMGWTIFDKYNAEITAYNQKVFGKFGDLKPDEQTIASLMSNPEFMDAMRGTFITKCASCHTASGGGMVGPNLTDDVYIHVKKLPDIYHVIDNGVTAKGMPAWGRQLSETQMILMAAYVGSLRGTNVPGGKGPEGDAIAPWPVVVPMEVKDDSAQAAS